MQEDEQDGRKRDELTLEGIKQFFVAVEKEEWKIEVLLDLIATDKSWNDEAARKTLLEVFQLAGDDSELVDSARRRLAMLLY